tara:strand:- start:12949 stop:13383 length:435 start_codon:yes stop_codon:yes gene_type:complete
MGDAIWSDRVSPILPNELWIKIWTLTAIVDSERSVFLKEIRKFKKKRNMEKFYREYHGIGDDFDWLFNDISIWMNDYRGTLFVITNKLKIIYKKHFGIDIKNNDDITNFEKGRSGKELWNLYYNILSEKQTEELYQRFLVDFTQ